VPMVRDGRVAAGCTREATHRRASLQTRHSRHALGQTGADDVIKTAPVQIAARFRRSVRIDTDINDPTSLESFYCPKSFADGLVTIARHLKETGQAAFTWTGPYGGGKSSLALAFAALLAGKPKVRAIAEAAVGPQVTGAIRDAVKLPPTQWSV